MVDQNIRKKASRAELAEAAKNIVKPGSIIVSTAFMAFGGVLSLQDAVGPFGWPPRYYIVGGMIVFVTAAAAILIGHYQRSRQFEEVLWNKHMRWLNKRGIPWSESAYSQWLRKGDLEILGHFWDGGFEDVRRTNEQNDLHITANGAPAHIIDELVKRGVKINQQDQRGYTPLMYATLRGNIDVVKRLLYHGADPDVRIYHNGATALHIAITQSKDRIVDVLLQNGANPDRPDDGGLVPLMLALTRGRIEVARTLIDAGADVHRRDQDGATIMDYAYIPINHDGQDEIVRYIADKGVLHAEPPIARKGGSGGSETMEVNWVPADEFLESMERIQEHERKLTERPSPYWEHIKSIVDSQ